MTEDTNTVRFQDYAHDPALKKKLQVETSGPPSKTIQEHMRPDIEKLRVLLQEEDE